MYLKRNRGITIIALTITIILMLILLGVTVTSAINGDLIDKAKDVKNGTQNIISSEGPYNKQEMNGKTVDEIVIDGQ